MVVPWPDDDLCRVLVFISLCCLYFLRKIAITWNGSELLSKGTITTTQCQNTNTVELQWLEHWWPVYHGLFELIFESLRNSSASSRKQIFRVIFLFYHEIVCCGYSLESPLRGDSNEYTQHTIFMKKIKKIPKLSLFASWPGIMINPQWLELPMSRTISYGPKDVRAIEIRLYSIYPKYLNTLSAYHTCR